MLEEQKASLLSKLFLKLQVYSNSTDMVSTIKSTRASTPLTVPSGEDDMFSSIVQVRKGKKLIARALPLLSDIQNLHVILAILRQFLPILSSLYRDPLLEADTLARFVQALMESICRQPFSGLILLLQTFNSVFQTGSLLSNLLSYETAAYVLDCILQHGQTAARGAPPADQDTCMSKDSAEPKSASKLDSEFLLTRWSGEARTLSRVFSEKEVELERLLSLPYPAIICHITTLIAASATVEEREVIISMLNSHPLSQVSDSPVSEAIARIRTLPS